MRAKVTSRYVTAICYEFDVEVSPRQYVNYAELKRDAVARVVGYLPDGDYHSVGRVRMRDALSDAADAVNKRVFPVWRAAAAKRTTLWVNVMMHLGSDEVVELEAHSVNY